MKQSKKQPIFIHRTDRRIGYIARHYGLRKPLRKTLEELLELACAILWLRIMLLLNKAKPKHFLHVSEEISDVRIMLDQIELLTGSASDCEQIRTAKLDRQIQRINGEQS